MRRRALSASGTISTGSSNEGPIDVNNYLTIVALEDGLTAQLSVNACEYCVDGDGNWKSLPAATNTEAINKGQTLSFRGNLKPVLGGEGIGTFKISKSCNLEGNCMSMLFGDDAAYVAIIYARAFFKLFQNCKTIKNVSSKFLPVTTLASHCYYSMFEGCTSLTTAPALPATTLASSCYEYMFNDCTSLTTAPALPATTLANYCYNYMFNGCTSLTTAPALPATTLVPACYSHMFQGCSKLNYIKAMFTTTPSSSNTLYWVNGVASTGKFIKNRKATWNVTATSNNSYIGIPSGWSVQSAAQ